MNDTDSKHIQASLETHKTQLDIENISINSSAQMLSLSLQHVNAVTTTTVDFTFEHLKQKKILDIQKISKYHKRSVRIYEL
jgi:hypothetical protein